MEMNQKECGIVCKENGTEQIERSNVIRNRLRCSFNRYSTYIQFHILS